MENDLIYRGSVKTKVSDTWWDEIDSIPAVDAEEVVHSYWEHKEDPEDIYSWVPWYCHHCGMRGDKHQTDYCPHCGARMDGEDGDVDEP